MKPLKTRNNGRWTEARWKGFIVSALRAASRRWPVKSDVLKSARDGLIRSKHFKRDVACYKCVLCGHRTTSTEMRADHIEPVVNPKTGWQSFDVFVERLFCEAENFQAICIKCHKDKTDEERRQRNEQRKSLANKDKQAARGRGRLRKRKS